MFLSERTLDRFVEQIDYDLDVKNLLPSDEYQILEEEGLVEHTKDHIYVPNGQGPPAYKITKLVTENFDLVRFMDQIIETIPFPFQVSLNVGFFAASIDCPDIKVYIKPSSMSSVLTARLSNLEEFWRFRKDLLKLSSSIVRKCWKDACESRKITRDSFPTSAVLLCTYIQKE